tara:strand:- start:131 stop:271 length:141 start_codon:yes stop_codon:yes gene_type:complete
MPLIIENVIDITKLPMKIQTNGTKKDFLNFELLDFTKKLNIKGIFI